MTAADLQVAREWVRGATSGMNVLERVNYLRLLRPYFARATAHVRGPALAAIDEELTAARDLCGA